MAEIGSCSGQAGDGARCSVMGSVGPCGGVLEPLGKVQGRLDSKIRCARKSTGCSRAGADVICSRMTGVTRDRSMVRTRANERNAPLCLRDVLCSDPEQSAGRRTMTGYPPEDLARVATAEGADVVARTVDGWRAPPILPR